jgi:hypothetical protein
MYEHRQMLQRNERGSICAPAVSATLWWQSDGRGYTEVVDYWEGTIKYFEFGERTPGLVENFDSSD